MKKTTLISLLGFLLLLGSCTHDGYETDNTALAVQQTSGKPARTDLAYIAQQLTSSYNGLNDSTYIVNLHAGDNVIAQQKLIKK